MGWEKKKKLSLQWGSWLLWSPVVIATRYWFRDAFVEGLWLALRFCFSDLAPHLIFGVVSSHFDVPNLLQLSRLRAALPPQMLQLLAKALFTIRSVQDRKMESQTECNVRKNRHVWLEAGGSNHFSGDFVLVQTERWKYNAVLSYNIIFVFGLPLVFFFLIRGM